MADVLLPAVPDTLYAIYKMMQNAPRNAIANGVVQNMVLALSSYAALDKALTDPADTTFGAYQLKIKEHHDERIAMVAPAIAQLKMLMNTFLAVTRAVDAGSIAAGTDSIFNTPLPVEVPPNE